MGIFRFHLSASPMKPRLKPKRSSRHTILHLTRRNICSFRSDSLARNQAEQRFGFDVDKLLVVE
jgi:hypothetical protein